MRCRSCGYSLWGITTGRCPECDATFRVTDYRFRPRAVAFACPHCGTTYAGTSETGHLVPSRFRCVQCHEQLDADSMVATPAPGVSEADTLASPNPWIDRERLGLVRAFFKSVFGILVDPVQFMRSIVDRNPAEGTVGDAFKFALWGAAGFCVLGTVVAMMLLAVGLALRPAGAGPMPVAIVFLSLPVAVSLSMCVGILLFPVIQGALGHLGLALAHARGGGFGRTMQVMFYVSAAGAVVAIPVGFIPFGGVLLFAWQIVVGTLMLREAHRTTTGRAAVGALFGHLIPVFIAVALAGGLVVAAVGAARAQAQAARAQAMASAMAMTAAEARVAACADIAQQLADAHDARATWHLTPLHAVMDGTIAPADLAAVVGGDDVDTLVIGSLPVPRLLARDAVALAAEAESLAAARDGATAPIRIGDAIFTYPSSDGDVHDWLIILVPGAPDAPHVACTQFATEVYETAAEFEAALERQNESRRRRYLPELPRPEDVRPTVDVRRE